MKDEKELVLKMLKTNEGCFISDCHEKKGDYWYRNFTSNIPEYSFDGKKAKKTFDKRWFYIERYPDKITKVVAGDKINKRYVINDEDMISKAMPKVVNYDDMNHDISDFYEYKYDKEDDKVVEVDFDINVIGEIANFHMTGDFKVEGLKEVSYKETKYEINKEDLEYQLIDEIIYPDFVKDGLPVKISSNQLYNVARNYIKDNMDGKYVKITSDYDFCLTVKKRIPYQVETFDGIKTEYKLKTVYERTPKYKKYKGYTVMESLTAKNSDELKKKIDDYLERLINIINKPIKLCDKCNGKGVVEEVKNHRKL